ncbi:transcription factor [Ganoderma sinense ZZ0214-1]|uniref:Transcription factor n=1 Tax=Ganoderma sinense ZZ0214-1 TaxID=1077348 RepID=A0A2G8RPT0_9APHY|nr:transcription factor [Ganoderma sinense ZZ0214-1]
MARTKKEEIPGIPRPPNSFFKFLKATVEEHKPIGTWAGLPRKIITQEVAKLWWAASEEVKAKYAVQALRAKEEHKRAHPEYRYRPRKKSKAAAAAKTKSGRLPCFYGSPSSSSTSSSASTPSPTTPVSATAMLAGGSSSGNAFGINSGYLHPNHHMIPRGAHATGLFPYVAQSNDYPLPPQVFGLGLADSSTYAIDMAQNVNFAPLPKADQASKQFSPPSYYQPPPSYAPQQAFHPFALGHQLQTGATSQQPFQPPPLPTFQPVTQQAFPPAPQQAFQHAPQQAVDPRLLTTQEHVDAAPAEPQDDSMSYDLQTTELGTWDKEFAPLDAGFCDFMSAWNNVKASATPVPDASSATSLPATNSMPSASGTLSPAPEAVHNLNVNAEWIQAPVPPSEVQEPSPLSSDLFFDPSFLLSLDDALGQQYNELCDALQALPPSAVWPEELNQHGIQM